MGGLIANGGATPSTTAPSDGDPIANDGFWPDIDLADLRASTRLTGNVTPARLRGCTIDAMLSVNDQLATYRATQIGLGWDSAADIGETVAGATALVHRYHRAIASTVQADLAERYRDWDTTRAGDHRADAESVAADDFRRNAQWAIAAILGRARNVIELI
jgi:hypothetical protein